MQSIAVSALEARTDVDDGEQDSEPAPPVVSSNVQYGMLFFADSVKLKKEIKCPIIYYEYNYFSIEKEYVI